MNRSQERGLDANTISLESLVLLVSVMYLEQSTALGDFFVGRTTVLDRLQGSEDRVQSSSGVALLSLSVETEQTSITV